MTFSTDIPVPRQMNPNDFHNPDLSSGTTQVKMSIGWIAIIISVAFHGPQRMKTIDFDHAALDTTYLLI